MIADYRIWLVELLQEFSCQTGTIHRSDDGAFLNLVAQIGVPEFLLEKISHIPFGKGIAGAAAQSREPVELCNLQEDLGGVARPDARKTNVSGSLAVPIFSLDGQRVVGVLGVGMQAPHDFTCEEKANLAHHAASLSEDFDSEG